MKRLAIRVSIAVAVFLPFAVVYVGVSIYNGIDDAYAQWGAADMVIDYMRGNDGKWPPNWEALRPHFEKNNGRVSGWSFGDFQTHVFIDFDANPERLRTLALKSDPNTVPFDVIHATSIWGSQMGDGPNAMLARYFRDKG
jgi:hypothetical protein